MNFRENNLDVLRVLFAAQVMVMHAMGQLDIERQGKFSALDFLSYFPGVPAFFFVSGILIYASYENSGSKTQYLKNRFFRIFPGLLFATLGGLIFILLARALADDSSGSFFEYCLWFVSQVSIGQAWNPDSFRPYGLGVVNGALWTITVEILFYIAIPIIFYFEKHYRYTCHTLFISSLVFYLFSSAALGDIVVYGKTLPEYLSLTPVIWGWMFMAGSLLYKYRSLMERQKHNFPLFIVVMWTLSFLMSDTPILFEMTGNRLGVVHFFAYATLIIYVGFHKVHVPCHYDLSYGIYIWHCVIMNYLIIYDAYSAIYVVVITAIVAGFSWFFVERPALQLKKRSLRSLI